MMAEETITLDMPTAVQIREFCKILESNLQAALRMGVPIHLQQQTVSDEIDMTDLYGQNKVEGVYKGCRYEVAVGEPAEAARRAAQRDRIVTVHLHTQRGTQLCDGKPAEPLPDGGRRVSCKECERANYGKRFGDSSQVSYSNSQMMTTQEYRQMRQAAGLSTSICSCGDPSCALAYRADSPNRMCVVCCRVPCSCNVADETAIVDHLVDFDGTQLCNGQKWEPRPGTNGMTRRTLCKGCQRVSEANSKRSTVRCACGDPSCTAGLFRRAAAAAKLELREIEIDPRVKAAILAGSEARVEAMRKKLEAEFPAATTGTGPVTGDVTGPATASVGAVAVRPAWGNAIPPSVPVPRPAEPATDADPSMPTPTYVKVERP